MSSSLPQPAPWPADRREAALARLLEDWADESLYDFEMHLRAADVVAAARAVDLLCAGRPGWERHLVGLLFLRSLRARLRSHGFGGWPSEAIEGWFFGHLDDLEALLDGRGWLVGDRRSMADVAVSPQIEEILRTSPLADRIRARPVLGGWLARQAPG